MQSRESLGNFCGAVEKEVASSLVDDVIHLFDDDDVVHDDVDDVDNSGDDVDDDAVDDDDYDVIHH